MALDWKKTVKPASSFEEFAKVGARTPKTAAEVVVAAIDKQIALFNAPKAEGRRWFEVKGDKVAFTIRYANKPLKLVGDETVVAVPRPAFVEVLESIKASVAKGEFKEQLDAGEAAVKKRTETMRTTRANKKAQ